MRVALVILGTEVLALTIGEPDTPDYTDEPGDCTTYPLGFTAQHELPDESGIPYREGWE